MEPFNSPDMMRAMLESVTDGLIAISPSGKVLALNAAIEKIFGYSESELLGRSVNCLLPAVMAAVHDCYLEKAAVSTFQHIHIDGMRKPGECFPISFSLTQGELHGQVFFTAFIRDLACQRISETPSQEKNRLLLAAIHRSLQPFMISAADGHFVEVNLGACRWLGYEEDELKSLTIVDLVPECDCRELKEREQSLFTKGIETLGYEQQFISKNGDTLWGYVSSTVVRNGRGETTQVVSQITDIGENKSLAIALAERNHQLEISNQDLDQFAYVASHDLKSPLNAIKKLVSWIEEDADGQLPLTLRGHLGLLKNRTERMMKLLNDLLLYARVGRLEGDVECINLQALCTKIFELLDGSDRFDLHTDNIDLYIPRVPFELVIRNLVSNAIKHHDNESGTIDIRCEIENANYLLEVMDNGPGIAPDMHVKALEMFQTLKSKDTIEGSGIGLSLVKRVVEQFNGSLTLISDGGRGTTISIRWPIAASANVGD